jgi:signal transduction histidine kinase
MFSRIVFNKNNTDRIIDSVVFLLLLISGIYIIKNVIKEITLREKDDQLVKNIGNLNKNLEKANLKLKELDQKKSEFMSLATHQLRAPLTSMRGYSSMILDGTFGKVNNPEVEDAIDKISRASTDLAMIVEDYLNISRIEQGRMQYNFSIFNLSDLIKDIIKEVKPTIDHAGLAVNFVYDESTQYKVNVDQGKIKQVLFNIIDNAIKYTPTGHIDIILGVKDGNKVLVKIQDTGVGIDPEILPTLFKKFKRAPDASKTNILGTGLGLYVANEILKAHNATAWAQSDGQGKGSSFYVELGMMS